MAKESKTINDWSGGINEISASKDLPENESVKIKDAMPEMKHLPFNFELRCKLI